MTPMSSPTAPQISNQPDELIDAPLQVVQGGTLGDVLHVWSSPERVLGGFAVQCSCGYESAAFYSWQDLGWFRLAGCPVENAIVEGQRHRAQRVGGTV